MARWQRDPRARRRVAAALAAVELLLLAIVFYVIFQNYLLRLCVRYFERAAPHAALIALIVTVVLLPGGIVQAVFYVKGRPWARLAFVGYNAVLILSGLVWWLLAAVRASEATPEAAVYGFVLPMVTLFPLITPLLVFRPTLQPGGRIRP